MIKIKSFWYKMIWFSPQKGKENKQTKFSNRFWLMIVKVKMKISDLILYQSKIGEKNENQKTKKNCISLTGCHKQQQQQYFDDKLDTNKRNDRKTKMKKKNDRMDPNMEAKRQKIVKCQKQKQKQQQHRWTTWTTSMQNYEIIVVHNNKIQTKNKNKQIIINQNQNQQSICNHRIFQWWWWLVVSTSKMQMLLNETTEK